MVFRRNNVSDPFSFLSPTLPNAADLRVLCVIDRRERGCTQGLLGVVIRPLTTRHGRDRALVLSG